MKLGLRLEDFRGKGVLVLAIPRGGVEIGVQVAAHLEADLALLIARKLPYPGSPESGFGAIAEDGSTYLVPEVAFTLSREAIEEIIAAQKQEIRRRIDVLRRGQPMGEMAGRTIILVDDGLAMGSTMQAAIRMCRNRHARKVVVGVPVAGKSTADSIAAVADELRVLEMPRWFQAVAQVYRHWHDVSDGEVIALLARWEKGRSIPGK